MSTYLILSIVVGLVALGVAVMLSNAISAANAGTARMKEIAGYIHEGAMAFLYREYKYLAIFIVVVAAIIATFLSVSTALCFIGGAVFSICAGYLGMNVATKANVRTAEAARHGMSEALKIAFSGGAVMGLGVVGLGIAGLSVAYFVFDRNIDIVTGFGLGASSIACLPVLAAVFILKLLTLVLTLLVKLKPVSRKTIRVTLLLSLIT